MDVNRCTPDTVIIDVDQPQSHFESHDSTYTYFLEDDNEDVFDRGSESEDEDGNFSSVLYHRENSVTNDVEDNLNSDTH